MIAKEESVRLSPNHILKKDGVNDEVLALAWGFPLHNFPNIHLKICIFPHIYTLLNALKTVSNMSMRATRQRVSIYSFHFLLLSPLRQLIMKE